MEKIVNIKVENIYPHPDNPRKDVGDVTELAESIKKNGIMQNLTVIPISALREEPENQPEADEISVKSDFHALIGHRRLAAAKKAGLTEVPCKIVSKISKKEQVAVMLEENMQRNDLTVFEQAQGFQMMLDLGETEESISEKTGFSKSTVRHRLNLAKLDQEELKKKTDEEGSFQLTLKDLYELEKIKDIKKRDKVLKEARDSRDLVWRAKQAADEEIREKNIDLFQELFKKKGIPKANKKVEDERYSGKWDTLQEWELDKEPPKTLKDFKREGLQWIVYYRKIAVIAPAKKKERKLSEDEIKQKELQEKKKEIKQKYKNMFSKVDEFIHGIIDGEIEPLKEDMELYKELMMTIIIAGITFYRSTLCYFYSGMDLFSLERDEPDKYKEFMEWESGLSELHLALAHMTTIKNKETWNYNGQYIKENGVKIRKVIDFLGKYGFSLSEEEEKLVDGTHELYVKR